MPNVTHGMLARIVKTTVKVVGAIEVPELIGRIVFVERAYRNFEVLHTIEGHVVVCSGDFSELIWMVSAKIPLPVISTAENSVKWMTAYEIPVFDAALRPLLDNNLDISDKEVKELYSKNGVSQDINVVMYAKYK